MIRKTLFAALLLLSAPATLWGQRSPLGIVSAQDTLKHVQLGLVAAVANGQAQGLQLSGFANMSASPFRGVQLSGISNISMGVRRGMQLSAMLNVSSGYMRGLQTAAYNFADSLNGTQIGLINVALAHPKGWQVGLVNVTRDTVAHKLGLVNVNPKTTIDYMFFGGTATKCNAAVRFRNRSTYNIIGMGTHYMGLDEKFSGALYYRIGQYFQLSPRWSVSGDLGFGHIETFERHSVRKPERLYSLQARFNVDYQLSPHVGLFASVGYGDTRYYRHATRYRSRMLAELGVTFRRLVPSFTPKPAAGATDGSAEEEERPDGPSADWDSVPQRPWIAAAEATGINAFVHLFDRYALAADYAQTTLHSWRRNITNGFVWDNDVFSTNLFAHPYHGNLYFNSARSNGLSFWQSAPYALGGSLMWEMLGEREPPAINDLVATTVGGICIGEIAHRISDLFIDERLTGFSRFLREAATTIVDPMKGLNRIVSGRAWHVTASGGGQPSAHPNNVDFSLSAGSRYLADDGALFRGEHNPYLNFYMEYGDILNRQHDSRPYDFFDAEVTFGLSKNQPIINQLSLLGRLWSAPMIEDKGVRAEVGIYQHFNYYDSKPVKDGTDLTPYRISEAAAVGPGVVFTLPSVGALSHIEQRAFLNAILLGGTKSDYYNVIDRDYNMGSGFSVKTKTQLEMRNFGRFILHAKFFRLFTWKGYEQKDLSTVDPLHLNAQGDKGSASLLVISPMAELDLGRGWSLLVAASFFNRDTHYKYYSNVKARTYEVRSGLTWHI